MLVLISLPAMLALGGAVSFYARNSGNSFVSSGEKRQYVLYVPRSYDRGEPTPLVISMHGAGLWGGMQREMSQWNRLAAEYGFIVVYPSGVRAGLRIWHVEHSPLLMKDVRFIAQLIDTLRAAYNIDPARIYADGLSNGGGMAFVLSCTLSDRIAAVGMVAAAQTLEWDWCRDARPVPMMAFHGTADPVVPYQGGVSWIGPRAFPNMPAWAASWARRNRCAPQPVDSSVATDVTRRAYIGCAADADVVLYTIEGGGHSWPGGKPTSEWFVGPMTTSIDATRELWSFFQQHPLRSTQ